VHPQHLGSIDIDDDPFSHRSTGDAHNLERLMQPGYNDASIRAIHNGQHLDLHLATVGALRAGCAASYRMWGWRPPWSAAEQCLHLVDLALLGGNDLVGEFEDGGVGAIGLDGLGHGDRSLVMSDHHLHPHRVELCPGHHPE
jgi:hypothetical protein